MTSEVEVPNRSTASYVRVRRRAVSSESLSLINLKGFIPPFYEKTESEKKFILDILSNELQVLFGHLSTSGQLRVVNAMDKMYISEGTPLIQQGAEGDNFYIVQSGKFIILKHSSINDKVEKVGESEAGSYFGELALMYNEPRAATCLAVSDSVVWALDRASFRTMVVLSENNKKTTYEELLREISLFDGLNRSQITYLSNVLNVQCAKIGERVIHQGEEGSRFYIVETGELVSVVKQGTLEIETMRYSSGSYFGELALMKKNGRRHASILAVTNDVRLLWIDRPTFERVLGPIMEVLEHRATKYMFHN